MNLRFSHGAVVALLIALAAGSGSGCGKAKENAEAASTTTAATEAPAAEEAASPAEESTTDSLNPQQFDVQKTLDASDKATQVKDWQAATDGLLKLQLSGSLRTPEESWQYNRRMTVLQDQLIQAADAGDPKAKAAMELLRNSRRIR